MTVNKAVFRCPCCDYVTHFEKALEAHQRHRKHFAKPEPEKAEEVIAKTEEAPAEEQAVVVKKTRKPRTKKTAEKEK